jgi:hypothetical protein
MTTRFVLTVVGWRLRVCLESLRADREQPATNQPEEVASGQTRCPALGEDIELLTVHHYRLLSGLMSGDVGAIEI